MAVSQLVEGGYCNSISNRQPFVIGIDFRPPVPAGWFLPRIRPSADVLQELMECPERAGAVTKIDAESSEIRCLTCAVSSATSALTCRH